MIGYRARLARDLERWQGAGWVTPDHASAISADAETRAGRFGLAQVLGLLGAVLLCFAAMTFVAANWQTMSKAARLGLLLAALWGSYGAAHAFFQRGQDAFAQAAVLTGCGVFGAAIMLIAQMYHMEGRPPDAVLVWCAGTALAGVTLRSNPALALAVALLGLWTGWETVWREGIHWLLLPAWAVLTGLCLAVTAWRPIHHLLALVLAGWTVFAGAIASDLPRHDLTVIAGLAALLFGAVAAPNLAPRLAGGLRDGIAAAGRLAEGYGLATAFAGLWLIQFVNRTPRLGLTAVATLAILLAAIAWALRHDRRAVLWIGYAAFSIELVSLYFKTLGTLLDTSLFFLLAGLLVIGLAWIAWRLASRGGGASPALPALFGARP